MTVNKSVIYSKKLFHRERKSVYFIPYSVFGLFKILIDMVHKYMWRQHFPGRRPPIFSLKSIYWYERGLLINYYNVFQFMVINKNHKITVVIQTFLVNSIWLSICENN